VCVCVCVCVWLSRKPVSQVVVINHVPLCYCCARQSVRRFAFCFRVLGDHWRCNGKEIERYSTRRNPIAKNTLPIFILINKFKTRLGEIKANVSNANSYQKTKHPRLGLLNATEWLRFIEVHTVHHTRQLKRIRRKLTVDSWKFEIQKSIFYPNCPVLNTQYSLLNTTMIKQFRSIYALNIILLIGISILIRIDIIVTLFVFSLNSFIENLNLMQVI
jgi:hypothetical protein